MDEKLSYVYIMASCKNGTMYVGVTSNLENRVDEHKQGVFKGFTEKYKVKDLVYFEIFGDIGEAIIREKQLKKWNRQWKMRIIEKDNPEWLDLSIETFNL